VKYRWIIVVFALIAASAFALSVQAGRWWSVGDVEIGPFGSRQCFGGDCRPTSLSWVGGSERWARAGIATWAGSLISTLVLLVIAGAVAAKRVPRLAARTALVAIATALLAGIGFIAQYPGVQGAGVDRGLFLFGGAILFGAAAAIGVLRLRKLEPAP
jgi:hypothetical protein